MCYNNKECMHGFIASVCYPIHLQYVFKGLLHCNHGNVIMDNLSRHSSLLDIIQTVVNIKQPEYLIPDEDQEYNGSSNR